MRIPIVLLLSAAVVACSRERPVSPPAATGSIAIRVENLSAILLGDPAPSSLLTGECVDVPAGVLLDRRETLRSVAYVVPERRRPVRRVLVSYDAAGRPVLVNDARFGPAPVTVGVDFEKGLGYVLGKPAQPNGSMLSRWSGTVDAILDDPRLGNVKEVIQLVTNRCTGG